MSCQKVVNVLAVASAAVSAAVVIGGVSVYVNRDSIIDNVKSQAIEAALGSLGGLGGGLGGAGLGVPDVGGSALPTGATDLSTPEDVSATPSL
tara:strand:+ start:613 stop:891 length:279 start_codon:yes stop_codon:yes gene_type:complete